MSRFVFEFLRSGNYNDDGSNDIGDDGLGLGIIMVGAEIRRIRRGFKHVKYMYVVSSISNMCMWFHTCKIPCLICTQFPTSYFTW